MELLHEVLRLYLKLFVIELRLKCKKIQSKKYFKTYFSNIILTK